jgi:hypothetical protein
MTTTHPTDPKTEIHVCSICGDEYQGFGHNAWPVNDGRCCNDCNNLIIARRISDMRRQER